MAQPIRQLTATELMETTRPLVEANLANADLTDDQKEAVLDRIGSILWFALDVQGNTVVPLTDYYRASNLLVALDEFMEGPANGG